MDYDPRYQTSIALSFESVLTVAEYVGYPVVLECLKKQKEIKTTPKIHGKFDLVGKKDWAEKYLESEG